jgi:hypothetical protein
VVGIVEIRRSGGAVDAPVGDRPFGAIRRAALRMISGKARPAIGAGDL